MCDVIRMLPQTSHCCALKNGIPEAIRNRQSSIIEPKNGASERASERSEAERCGAERGSGVSERTERATKWPDKNAFNRESRFVTRSTA